MGVRPAWLPEYGIDLGPALDPLPADIGGCWNPTRNVYAVTLPGPMWRVDPSGGSVPSDGTAPGMLAYTGVQSVQLGAHRRRSC